VITKTAINHSNFRNEIEFTNSAREAWEYVLKTLLTSSKILLPSYIGITDKEGSGIYDPVINSGVSHDFYLLNSDLSISIKELEKCLESEKYDLILLVHYFGFQIENINEVLYVCKKHGLIVVEDCAHLFNYSIYDYSKAGTYGDFTFYSLHKNFPLSKGGMLVQNNLEIKKPNFNKIDVDASLCKKVFSYNIKSIADKRRDNFKRIHNQIINIEGVKPLKTLSLDDIPHNYPMIVENNLREKLYFWLIEKQVTLIALYYRLIDPLKKEKYESMNDLSRNILNLPVHQDITEDEISKITSLVKQGILELQ
jgi:dTDP-4-amino-4,6-dideoxygalactose transaminase